MEDQRKVGTLLHVGSDVRPNPGMKNIRTMDAMTTLGNCKLGYSVIVKDSRGVTRTDLQATKEENETDSQLLSPTHLQSHNFHHWHNHNHYICKHIQS